MSGHSEKTNSLTLSTVSSYVALLTCAGIFITDPSIHASDAAGLDCTETREVIRIRLEC